MKLKFACYLSTLFFLFALTVLFAGCAKPPQQEIDAANKALEEAKSVDAAVYASPMYKQATDLISQMNVQLKNRYYKDALKSAIEAKEKAVESRGIAIKNKAKYKDDAIKAADDLRLILQRMKDSYANLETAKVPDIAPIKDQITAYENSIGDVDQMIKTEKFRDAMSKAFSMRSQGTQIEQAIAGAKASFDASKAKKAAKPLKKGKK